jgi:hypothetical protein
LYLPYFIRIAFQDFSFHKTFPSLNDFTYHSNVLLRNQRFEEKQFVLYAFEDWFLDNQSLEYLKQFSSADQEKYFVFIHVLIHP